MTGEPHALERRIRAAMELAGIGSAQQLADLIGTKGLGARTLRKFWDEEDPRSARPHELRAIADACELPVEFFTMDFHAAARVLREQPVGDTGSRPRPDAVLPDGTIVEIKRLGTDLAEMREQLKHQQRAMADAVALVTTNDPVSEADVAAVLKEFGQALASAVEEQRPAAEGTPGTPDVEGHRRPAEGAAGA